MANTTVKPVTISAAQRAFAARAEMQGITLASQAVDHHFYGQVASTVEDVTSRLTAEFSRILQVDAPQWSISAMQAFALCSNIQVALLEKWQGTCKHLTKALASVEDASKKTAAAKELESKFSGVLWGAKSGYEKQHAEYAQKFKVAQDHEWALVKAKNIELAKAKELGTRLLSECMANATSIGRTPVFGKKIGEILQKATHEASTTLATHNASQLAYIEKMQEHLNELSALYGK